MTSFNRKAHWENIYHTKHLEEVSWYQPKPETSLQLLQNLEISKDAKIIDIGGGDSFLVDHLLEMGFRDLTILDISEKAIERAKKRLGEKANKINWIVSDILDFEPTQNFDFWHDRAAFHFLTEQNEIEKYVRIADEAMSKNGKILIATFSEDGPKKCSGIEIRQYTNTSLEATFSQHFKKITCVKHDHKTPSQNIQNFIFCAFESRN
ncbi:class I SAM-dependent methyltransferase [Namhaeicola litoreus]|uniref:Class I SAM-dependent methyltransferase n=1 Tax=Namhaeicola litoreus TaxID=1052145 RepID=A0ABW3Y011_9FLAO